MSIHGIGSIHDRYGLYAFQGVCYLLFRERPEDPGLQKAYLKALIPQTVDYYFRCSGSGTHDHNDAIGVFGPVLLEEPVPPAEFSAEFLADFLYYGHRLPHPFDLLPLMLKIIILQVKSSRSNGLFQFQKVVFRLVRTDKRFRVLIVQNFYAFHAVAYYETVRRHNNRHSGLLRNFDRLQHIVVGLLAVLGEYLDPARVSHHHRVRVVAMYIDGA